MGNEKSNNRGNRRTPPPKKPWPKYEDDRTPTVKKIDKVCKIIAVLLSLLVFANIHVLARGGGFDSDKAVTLFGLACGGVETQVMEPEIKEKSAVITVARSDYEVGDVVRYSDGESNTVGRVTGVYEDTDEYTVVGDNESAADAVRVKAEDVSGEVVFKSTSLYGFLKFYLTSLGAALTVLVSFLFFIMSDILMFPKRRKAAKAKHAAYRRELENKVSEGGEAAIEELNPIEKRQAKRQAKLEKERAEIAEEMKEMQKKMQAEEEELKKEGVKTERKGKKK